MTQMASPLPDDAGVSLSETAARHISSFLSKRGRGLGIRLGVRTSGCSGMAYKVEFVDHPESDDMIFEQRGVRVYVDPKSYPYLAGTVVEYAKEGLSEGFRFTNPNVKDQCGCGESFKV